MDEPLDVVCIGAAVVDVFLQGSIFTPKTEADGEQVEEFKLGSKNDIDGVVFSTGGGATNAAVTFCRQGLEAAYLGKVGRDLPGESIRKDLEKDGVNCNWLTTSELGTGYSTLLLAPNGERTILTYRGASTHYDITKHDLETIRCKWFYVSSLEGNFEVLETVFLHAREHDIQVAWNPGKKELEDPHEVKALLPHVSVLSLNKDEMQLLYPGSSVQELAQAAAKTVKIAVVTDGPKGLAACDGKKVYVAGMYEDVPVIDRTGAGDAFCSGFTAAILKESNIENAITLGSANSTSVVGKVGAKSGILPADADIHTMNIAVSEIR